MNLLFGPDTERNCQIVWLLSCFRMCLYVKLVRIYTTSCSISDNGCEYIQVIQYIGQWMSGWLTGPRIFCSDFALADISVGSPWQFFFHVTKNIFIESKFPKSVKFDSENKITDCLLHNTCTDCMYQTALTPQWTSPIKIIYNQLFGSTNTVGCSDDSFSAGSPGWTRWYQEYKNRSLYWRFVISWFVTVKMIL